MYQSYNGNNCNNSNNNYVQPVFVAAPAPVLRDDGEITVVSSATRPYPRSAAPSMPSEITIDVPTPPTICNENKLYPEHSMSTALVPSSTAIRKPLVEHSQNGTKQMLGANHDSPRYALTQKSEPHHTYPREVEQMKLRRKTATVAAGVAGGAVGLVVLGPVGMVVGAAGATLATRTIGKRRERRMRDKIADRQIAEQARDAPPVKAMSAVML